MGTSLVNSLEHADPFWTWSHVLCAEEMRAWAS